MMSRLERNGETRDMTTARIYYLVTSGTVLFYMHTPFILRMNFLHVQMICIADLHDCVNS